MLDLFQTKRPILGDRVRIVGTNFTGRLMMIYSEKYDDEDWKPMFVIFDDNTYQWFAPEQIVGFRGYCPECQLYTKAPEGGFQPGHRCAKNYGRCETQLEYKEPKDVRIRED